MNNIIKNLLSRFVLVENNEKTKKNKSKERILGKSTTKLVVVNTNLLQKQAINQGATKTKKQVKKAHKL